ncbi:MAG: ABC transporter substrate-binding protein [Propionibacteriaceae bacterium]|nr:ABC transporter substrate-binding protein [Propionibacteriaceae bacterium]
MSDPGRRSNTQSFRAQRSGVAESIAGTGRRLVTVLSAAGLALTAGLGLAACGSQEDCSEADGGCGGRTAPTAGPTVVGLTFIPNIQFAPFYVAATDGLLPDGVELRHHGASEGLFTALAAGQEQFVVAGGDEILQARAQGVDVVAVAPYYQSYPARLIVPADSAIQTLADLKGHSVGLPGRYGENWFALVLALAQAGLTEQDVTIAEIGYTQLAALSTGKVDATIGFANGDAVNFAAAGFPVRAIDPEVPLVSICLATTSALAETEPELVRGVVTALGLAIASVVADRDHALQVAAQHIPDFDSPEAQTSASLVLEATVPLFVGRLGQSPGLDPAQWRTMAEAMAANGLLPGPVEASQAMSDQFTT